MEPGDPGCDVFLSKMLWSVLYSAAGRTILRQLESPLRPQQAGQQKECSGWIVAQGLTGKDLSSEIKVKAKVSPCFSSLYRAVGA
jgi:hypothetical protein